MVGQVLLADGWHTVEGASFTLDAYEYTLTFAATGEFTFLHGAGHFGVCATEPFRF